MKIETKKMVDFLNKGGMSEATDGGRLIFDKDMLKLTTVARDQTTFYEGGMKKDIITAYVAGETHCIKDIKNFMVMLRRMNKETEIKIDGDHTIVLSSGTKKIMSKLADKEFIDAFPETKFEYDFKTKILTEEIKEVLKDCSIFPVGSAPVLQMTVTGSEIRTKITEDDNTVENTIKIEEKTEVDITVKFSVELLSKVINTLTAEYVTLHIKSDYPLKVEENVGNYNINKWYLAPRVDDE